MELPYHKKKNIILVIFLKKLKYKIQKIAFVLSGFTKYGAPSRTQTLRVKTSDLWT